MAETPDLASLEKEARDAIAAADSIPSLVDVRARFMGKKGAVSSVLRGIGGLAPEERGRVGQEANAVKSRIEEAAAARKQALEASSQDRSLAEYQLDVSLPGTGVRLGHLHPVTDVNRTLERFFVARGFSIEEGPEVETDYYNFEALNFPADHPSRDMQDTFFVEGGFVLRTHTSPVQIRTMTGRTPPFRFIAPGRVYRHDASPRHSPMFQQVEGFAVGEDITFADLKGILHDFARFMFRSDTQLRFRSSYFPFTEPSAELDYACPFCQGDGCNTCSQTGWIEWGGCGMIHPNVFANCGIDSERFQGYAFGMGLERAAMNRHEIPQIRHLYDGDLRVLEQF